MPPTYSVIIPAYNAQAYIGEALESVLSQTVAPAQVIVVDDGSTDRTAEVAAAMGAGITVITKENGGPGSATTAGFTAATGDLVATLDSDDIWLPQKMERQIAFLSQRPELMAVFTKGETFQDGESAQPPGAGGQLDLWTRTTMVYRADGMRAIGGMRDFPGNLGELIDWLGRGRELGHRHHMMDEVLAMRRLRSGSLSDTRERERMRGYLVVARDALARRKQRESEG